MDKTQLLIHVFSQLDDIKETFEKVASCGIGKEDLDQEKNKILGTKGYFWFLTEPLQDLMPGEARLAKNKCVQFKSEIENIYEKYKNLPETIREIPLG